MRVAGVTIPENKRLEIALTAVYGIGRSRARKVLDRLKIDYGRRVKDLKLEEENAIRKEIGTFKIEGDLRREVQVNIKRLKDIKAYRGIRHLKHLPVRGQRTRTNTRTVKGNKRITMGSGHRKIDKT